MLMNFCDSAFGIGEDATEVSQRYIKQIKQRNTEQIYNENHEPIKAYYKQNTGIIICFDINHAIELIRANPIGLNLNVNS